MKLFQASFHKHSPKNDYKIFVIVVKISSNRCTLFGCNSFKAHDSTLIESYTKKGFHLRKRKEFYLVDRRSQFLNTISMLYHIFLYHNKIVQEENVLHVLDIYIWWDRKYSFHIHTPLNPINHFRLLLLDHFDVIIPVYYLSVFNYSNKKQILQLKLTRISRSIMNSRAPKACGTVVASFSPIICAVIFLQ